LLLAAGVGLALPRDGQAPAPKEPSEPAAKAPVAEKPKLVVHEWGTFLSVQGSNGVTLGGMVASEESLPPFVESRTFPTWMRTQFLSKMETPVTYFYTDKPMTVSVKVDMPRGILTHWFPMVRSFGPDLSVKATSHDKGSFLNWNKVELIPHTPNLTINAGTQVPTLWRVKPDDTWRFARETDSALVRVFSRNEQNWSEHDYEKFLFYRGLGTADTPLEVHSSGPDEQLKLTLHNRSKHGLQGLFAIRVEGKEICFAPLKDLAGNATRAEAIEQLFTEKLPLEEGMPHVKQAVADALIRAGLFEKEAWAMVNSWEKGYFRTDGIRLLYVLPRESVDALIPIEIKPAPEKLVRVMVGRTEVLTPAQEQRIEQWIGDLGASEFPIREAASTALAKLGRLGEPALRRVAAITRDAEVRARAEKLLEKAAKE
jgi:hypothetical protein